MRRLRCADTTWFRFGATEWGASVARFGVHAGSVVMAERIESRDDDATLVVSSPCYIERGDERWIYTCGDDRLYEHIVTVNGREAWEAWLGGYGVEDMTVGGS